MATGPPVRVLRRDLRRLHQIAHLGDDVENYGVYILFALVMFNFFAEVTNTCVRSLVARENLLRKISFPRLAIPMAITLTGLFNLGGTLVAVFIFAIGERRLSGLGLARALRR